MANDKRRFRAVIDGRAYIIVGSASDAHMQAVTALLNEQLTEIKTQSPEISREDASILLAFNAISDQLKRAEVGTDPSDTQEG